jgi:hypothetical protein
LICFPLSFCKTMMGKHASLLQSGVFSWNSTS